VGVDWPLCVPQPWREIDASAHGDQAYSVIMFSGCDFISIQ